VQELKNEKFQGSLDGKKNFWVLEVPDENQVLL
jgi:hypothetical protein